MQIPSLTYGLITPIYVGGFFLNTVLVLAFLRQRKTLLVHRIDHVYVYVLSVCCIFSALFSVRFLLGLKVDRLPSEAEQRMWAALTSISVIAHFTGNLPQTLHLERFFTFHNEQFSEASSFRFFAILGTLQGINCLIICILFVTSPCSSAIWPDYELQRWIWLILCSTALLCGFSLILYLYIATYRSIKRLLHATTTNHKIDEFRILLERNVFWNSVLMSVTVFACYLPISIFLGIGNAFKLDEYTFQLVLDVTYACVAMDVGES
ncbi:hypothetical protein BC830DRAFT_1117580 [Chytriomyces sp. MP71]|nr:hypothetical protein BC830DRAFT_1117580 [Chytriomyces sp. MP71]